MKKQDLQKLIKEELKKALNESKIEFEEVVPNGTIIYINGKKARVRANFRNSDGPSILFDYIEDNGLRGEPGTVALNNPTIDQREVDLKITDEITEIFSDNKAIRANARQAQLLSRRVLSRMGDLNTYRKRSNQAPDQLNAIVSLTKEELEKLKKLLLLVHTDHPSVKGSLEYVYEIQQETKNMRPIEVMSVLGSGEVIKEYIEKVVKPLKKIIIF